MADPMTLDYADPSQYAEVDGRLYDLADPDELAAYHDAYATQMLEALEMAVSCGLIVVCGCELF